MKYSREIIKLDGVRVKQITVRKAESVYNEGKKIWVHVSSVPLGSNSILKPVMCQKGQQGNKDFVSLKHDHWFRYGVSIIYFAECDNKFKLI